MEIHPLYGPVVPEKGWVPAPSFLLRRDRILRLLTELAVGKLLEIGCCAGTLLHELDQRGFTCEALETSEPALEIARHVNANKVVLHQNSQPNWVNRFDYLFAFEVLEHIEDDRSTLLEWRSWIKPGGVILISVPAHMKKWTASDVWAGHVRRYERTGLLNLINSSGFTIEHFETYGFPLANLISPLRARFHAHNLNARRKDKLNERIYNNDMSGVERNTESKFYPLLKSLPGKMLMHLACLLQSWSSKRDWGTGYLVMAKRNE
jgi:SAM-dependent methyltransferase